MQKAQVAQKTQETQKTKSPLPNIRTFVSTKRSTLWAYKKVSLKLKGE